MKTNEESGLIQQALICHTATKEQGCRSELWGTALEGALLQSSTKMHHLQLPTLPQTPQLVTESHPPSSEAIKTLRLTLYEGPETNISFWEMAQEEHVRKQSNKQHLRWI